MDITPYVIQNNTVLCYRYCYDTLKQPIIESLGISRLLDIMTFISFATFMVFFLATCRNYENFKEKDFIFMFSMFMVNLVGWMFYFVYRFLIAPKML